jgi:hypothetical protein
MEDCFAHFRRPNPFRVLGWGNFSGGQGFCAAPKPKLNAFRLLFQDVEGFLNDSFA